MSAAASTQTSDESPPEDPDYPLENTDVSIVYRQQGPFGRCKACGGITWSPYRCNAIVDHNRDGEPVECGKDLVGSGIATAGNDGFRG